LNLKRRFARDSRSSLVSLITGIPHIRLKSNRQNSPRMLLEGKLERLAGGWELNGD
jgi:hypothetical protein